MRHAISILAVLTWVAISARGALAAPIVYDQPSNFPNGTVFASQNATNGFGNFATAYDNFTLAGTTSITDVHWQGGYFNSGTQVPISQFTINFYADNAGQPGAQLSTQSIAGNANETFVGNEFFGPVFNYSLDLTTPFLAAGGTAYWLSIVATANFPPQWGWHTGTGGDGVSFQDFFANRTTNNTDLAFSLTANAVPEPSTFALFGIVLALGACCYFCRGVPRIACNLGL